MADGLAIVEDEVRELIRRNGLDPSTQVGEVRRLVDDVVRDYDERSLLGVLPALGELGLARRRIMDAVAGLGALQPLLDDPDVEEIWLNGPHEVFCARGGTSELTSIRLSEAEVPALVERMLKSSGRRLDLSQPFVDCQLADGSRLHVVIPDITRKHWAVNIRKFIARANRLEHLVELGSLSRQAAHYLDVAVGAGLNVLVSGATQAGKTTMLNCLASSIGSRERVVTIEEIFELKINLRDVVALQTRQQNLEGNGEINMRRLVKEALRMRPDRLVIGEVREAESLDMLIALNSGLPEFELKLLAVLGEIKLSPPTNSVRTMESIEVQFTTAGQPLRVRRQGRVWKVVAEPVRWFERFAWWETERRAPKGTPFRIDSLVWQVQVSLGARSSEPITWELVNHAPTGGWRVREPERAAA